MFCGASSGRAPSYSDAARAFGSAAASRGIGVVYGCVGYALFRWFELESRRRATLETA